MFKLFGYLRPYSGQLTAVVVLMLLQSLAQLYLPTLLSDIVDIGVIHGDTGYIWKAGGLMLLVAAGATLCVFVASYLLSRSAAGFGASLRSAVFGHVESFSLQEFDKLGTSSLITRTTNDITQVQQVVVMMRMFIGAPTMLIGGVIMSVVKDARLAIVLIAVIPVLAAAIAFIMMKGVPLFKAMQLKIDRLNLVLREHLTGIRVIRAFNRSAHETARFDDANVDFTRTATRVGLIVGTMMPVMMLIFNLSVVVILWYGGLRIDAGHMQVGDLMAFIQYAMQIMFSMFMMTMIFMMIPRASASATRLREVLGMTPSIVNTAERQGTTGHTAQETRAASGQSDVADGTAAGAGRSGEAAGDSLTEAATGLIEFDDVSFRYPGAEQPALTGISFQAKPGEVTAIIGGTGSGKSTLLNLLLRFYDAESGSIRVNGQDVRDADLESLRERIGFVPQKAVLFSGTVASNIRFGREAATDDEVRAAAETAQAASFIEEMKDGYASAVTQGGTNLSGGQKQRLAIARALVRRPDIYVFDDSFSALDFKTDARLREALRKETANATVLIVAQRVSTIRDADRILVLEEGRIAGIGTHRELLNSCGVYREIVASQLSEEEIA
ncbi:ABC transporter ATP-binding protein [Paenibacillus athensensis]|uniref:Multidrug ABC transporter ATP-binding protein n=1 Tax=Paenibacillus athensensis TaxID=1967502 RepID=A0A4Y8PU24_9BACL|nr:ABC transporter ATP-binding protein [Paenibacillus athensensis]MCD1261640.1 ABC transporter ATP-binding protein [Paenibacillus athensensis]